MELSHCHASAIEAFQTLVTSKLSDTKLCQLHDL
jgi:hypothetical protein